MGPTLDEHQTAVVALLDTAVAPKHAHPVDEVPAQRPVEYVQVQVTEIFTAPDQLLLNATTNVRRYRATVWWFSRISVSNALLLREKCFEALRFARITVAGDTYPPAQYEGTEDDVVAIDGWFVGSADFTY
ncbi:hypothetical protein F9L07_25295 [Pimelobacter simplex]|uniref:Uncharacterized protein n=1 Tax=Nocardioides simplex TaxID=2045 RepID=A0A7J5DSM3_NOCSI|nr:hypothetical protein [Pimelobacter simplex]KAB2807988.1 hypothetical protein F9L07_25295 [Pimelobacter simplex]